MKKALFFSALAALFLVGCKSDEPQTKHQVTFRVPALKVDTEPMNAPAVRKVAPLTDDDGSQMTDLILFDGATYLMRQQNTDPDFGTVTVMLTAGEHNLHFIATRSTELSYDEGVLNCASLRSTFGKHYYINVTGGSDEYVTMDRLTGQVSSLSKTRYPQEPLTYVFSLAITTKVSTRLPLTECAAERMTRPSA